MENKIQIGNKSFYVYDIVTIDSVINMVSSKIIYPPGSLLFSLEVSWWSGYNKLSGYRNLLLTDDKDFKDDVIFSNYIFNRPSLVKIQVRNVVGAYLARINLDSLRLISTSNTLYDLPIIQDEVIKFLDCLNKNRYED